MPEITSAQLQKINIHSIKIGTNVTNTNKKTLNILNNQLSSQKNVGQKQERNQMRRSPIADDNIGSNHNDMFTKMMTQTEDYS